MTQINLSAAHLAAQTQAAQRAAPRPMTVGDFAELATKALSPKATTTFAVQPSAAAPAEPARTSVSTEPQRAQRPGTLLDIRV